MNTADTPRRLDVRPDPVHPLDPVTPVRPVPIDADALRPGGGPTELPTIPDVPAANDPDPTPSTLTPPPIMKNLAVRALLTILPRVLALITPKLKAAVQDLLDRAKEKARTTTTALDDAFVNALQIALVGGDPDAVFEGFDDGWLGLFRSIGPELRELVEHGVLELEKLADGTANRYDDMAVSILKGALGIEANTELARDGGQRKDE